MFENEVWVDIRGYEGKYKISNYGRVFEPKAKKYLSQVYIGKDGKGYLSVFLAKGNRSRKERVHRLVARHFLENPERFPKVRFKDGNCDNTHASNLEWYTVT